jgi:serine/threonine protein kinase
VIELSRYVIEPLRKDEDYILYRGRSQYDGSQILALAPLAEHPAPEILKRLEHECSLREELDPKWVARPIAMACQRDRTVLVLEDPGGVPLDQLLDQPLEVAFSLRLAISLSRAIDHLHQRNIIHKDIKPANVLVNSVTGRCWLMGLGIASQLPRERQAPEPPEFVAGTLVYMAPEQTGRMNRSIDSRSDLYSLGVTLYEVLTGSLPFAASTPMEWVHCHIARQPDSPSERLKTVPEAVSAIITKLLAKTGIRALAKKTPPQMDWLDINETIGEVLAMVRNAVQRNRVPLQTQLGNDLPLIIGDRIQLQQVILNLLINAIEAMGEVSEGSRELGVSSEKSTEMVAWGSCALQIHETREDRLADSTLSEAEGACVLIAVRDSGPGVDPKDLDRLFDAFYTTKPQGLGMGLAISRSIIEAHGGRLWAKANQPRGTVFQFTLPVRGERIS